MEYLCNGVIFLTQTCLFNFSPYCNKCGYKLQSMWLLNIKPQ